MKKITISLSVLCVAIQLNATQITFLTEVNELILDGNTIDQTNSSGLTATGFFVAEGTDFSDFIGASAWEISDNSLTLSGLNDVKTLITGTSGYSGAAPLGLVPDTAPESFGVIRETEDAGAAGFHPVFLVHTAPDLEQLTVGDSIGLATTSFSTLASGTEAIGFNTTNSWDTFLLGESGSLSMASVVPEPSSFALLAGCFGLAWVMVRRRA